MPRKTRSNGVRLDPLKGKSADRGVASFLPYPLALKELGDRLGATAEEVAAWVSIGPETGGLSAYLHINELDPPPRFFFNAALGNDPDYLSPLMACWFKKQDVASFQPVNRFVTGENLIVRWAQVPGLQPKAFIQAKIAESRLSEIHPVFGGTQATFPGNADYPPIETGLFVLSNVEEIERLEVGVGPAVGNESGNMATALASDELREHLKTLGRKGGQAKVRNESEVKRKKRETVQEIWKTGRYKTKDECAEQECAALDMPYSAARKALINLPNRNGRAKSKTGKV